MTIYRHFLRYSPALAEPNTFFWIPELETIRCRIRVASANEVSPVEVHLRFRRLGKALDLVHVHPHDETTFITEAAILHPDLPKLELVLTDVPEEIAKQLRHL